LKYYYRCRDCLEEIDIERPMNSDEDTTIQCPNCGSKNVTRRWVGIATIFKGSGFYKTSGRKEEKE
jgi:putative FmdB family regulatory protein